MAYDFSMPIIQGLLARRALEEQAATEEPKPLLSLLSNPEQSAPAAQSPPQPHQSPQSQEPLDGKQMIDVSMANALDIPQAPNSYALNVQRGLLTQKQAYADAKTDAEKANAHSTAEILRNKANAAGIDVSGYGSDVSLGDAVNNLASQEARDIMGAFQGYYSRDSGQYYNDKYIEGLMRGYSPRQSRKVAEALTGSYKADRVQYLDGLLNSYGRADTALANQILASMIPESPALAQFYTSTNPTPLNDYNAANTAAQEAIRQGYQLDLLGKGFEYDTKGREQAHNYNLQYKAIDDKNARRMLGLRHGYGEREADNALRRSEQLYAFQKDIDFAQESAKAQKQFDLFKDKVDYIKSLQPKELTDAEKVFQNSYMAAKLYGRSDEEAAQFAGEQAVKSAIYGVEGVKGASNKEKSSGTPKMTAEQQEKYNTYKNLLNVAHDTSSDEDIARLEEFVNGEEGVGKTFSPELYQGFNDSINALKGFQRKTLNDDDGATAYWSRVKDVNILERMYPSFNFDYYWERRGGKPK